MSPCPTFIKLEIALHVFNKPTKRPAYFAERLDPTVSRRWSIKFFRTLASSVRSPIEYRSTWLATKRPSLLRYVVSDQKAPTFSALPVANPNS